MANTEQKEWHPVQHRLQVYAKMSKLVINTSQRLYKPIEIEINGKTYVVKAIFTHKFLKKMGEYDEAIDNGDTNAPFERLEMLIGKQAVIEKLDIREINEITKYVITNIYKADRDVPVKEKNLTGPGEEN